MATPASSALLRRALLQAQLKVGPQEDALAALAQDQAAEYARSLAVNRSTSAGVAAAIDNASPAVKDAFSQALDTVHAQQTALAGLGQSSSVPGEQAQAYDRRVGEQLANAMTDLTTQRTAAVTGRAYADQSARDTYLAGRAKIQQEAQSLAGQQGALTASTYGDLADASAQRALTRRGQTLSHQDRVRSMDLTHTDRQAALNARGTGKPPRTGLGSLKPQQETRIVSDIETARTWLSHGTPRDVLVTGGSFSAKNHRTGKMTTIHVPRIADPVVLQAAQELDAQGQLSRKSIDSLHRYGVHIPTPWRPTPQRRVAGLPVSQVVQAIQGALP